APSLARSAPSLALSDPSFNRSAPSLARSAPSLTRSAPSIARFLITACYGDYMSICNSGKDCRKGLVCEPMGDHSMCTCGGSLQVEWIEALETCVIISRLNQECSIEDTIRCHPFDKTFCDMSLEPPKCQCTEGLKEKDGKCVEENNSMPLPCPDPENGATSLTGYSLLLTLSIMFTGVLA
ncbi:unnamed protein product, partial [Cyprideis torosa]